MIQLILIVMAIALVGLLVVASINYLPWWHKGAEISEQMLVRSFSTLETAFDSATVLNDGVEPSPLPVIDGGLMARFGNTLGFQPGAVPGYTWSYGVQNNPLSEHYGLKYFCMHPKEAGITMSEPALKGVQRAKARYSDHQVVTGYGCGDQSPHVRSDTSVTVTVYVKAALSVGDLAQ